MSLQISQKFRRLFKMKAFFPPQADELAAHLLKMGFAKWQVPDRYEWIASIPRTSTGKFYKLKLREMFPK